ncbi:potassium-transporting ATPase subunit F [Nevskia sp.]|nr:potassium-transporting ATPase subunit F [Nevskia sp.]
MTLDHLLGGFAVIVLLAYLGYALLKPEKFQ